MNGVVGTLTDRLPRLTRLIEAEFEEMPGMRLTRDQVRRLWNLSRDDCDAVLNQLTGCGRLVCDQVGQYRIPREDY